MGSPGTVLRGLVKVSGGPERVHGVSWDGLESSWEVLDVMSMGGLMAVVAVLNKGWWGEKLLLKVSF